MKFNRIFLLTSVGAFAFSHTASATQVVTGSTSAPAITVKTSKNHQPALAINTNVGGNYYNLVSLAGNAAVKYKKKPENIGGEKPVVRFDISSNKPGNTNGFIIMNPADCSVSFYNPDGTLKGSTGSNC